MFIVLYFSKIIALMKKFSDFDLVWKWFSILSFEFKRSMIKDRLSIIDYRWFSENLLQFCRINRLSICPFTFLSRIEIIGGENIAVSKVLEQIEFIAGFLIVFHLLLFEWKLCSIFRFRANHQPAAISYQPTTNRQLLPIDISLNNLKQLLIQVKKRVAALKIIGLPINSLITATNSGREGKSYKLILIN